MTNEQYIELFEDGESICIDIINEAEDDPEVPPTKDQELVRRLRDWIDRVLSELGDE